MHIMNNTNTYLFEKANFISLILYTKYIFNVDPVFWLDHIDQCLISFVNSVVHIGAVTTMPQSSISANNVELVP